MATKKKSKSKPKAPEDPAVTAWYEQFRARLRAGREEVPTWTQEVFAGLLGIPLASYKQMEGGRRTRFPLHKIEKLANVLRTSCDFILTGKSPRGAQADDDDSRRAA